MEKIIDILIESLPLWYVLIIALIIVGMRFYYTRFKPIEDRTSKANCQRNTEGLDALASDIKDLKRDIEQIKIILANKFPRALDLFGRKNSPRVLNDMGQKLFAEIGGEKFLDDNRALFFEYIDKEAPKTALDVESAAYMACHALSVKEIFNSIKNFVYNCPEIDVVNREGEVIKYEITMSDICFILSIPLRDLYLKEHDGIVG